MRAVVAHGPGDFRLTDVADPQPPAGGAVVAVEAAGVCAADRMLWRGDGPWTLNWPFTPGHELLGRVVAVGPGATHRIGDRVTAEVKLPCGVCPACHRGQEHLCPTGLHLGSGIPGAFAEQVALPAGCRVHRVPEDLPARLAVLVEPAACAVHAVRRGGVGPGDRVAVLGLGTIGFLVGLAAQEAGALAAVEARSPAKADLAHRLGLEARQGSDYDVVVECSGDAQAAVRGVTLCRPGGRVVLYGVYREPALLDLNRIAELGELDVRGGHLAPGCFPAALQLLARHPEAAELVTSVHPLEDLGEALGATRQLRVKAMILP